MEEIVNYLANHQEKTKFPDREAKQIRNHPFMTQLDFFDTNEDQKRAWEEEKRKREVKEIATQMKSSEALERAKQKRIDTEMSNSLGKEMIDEGFRNFRNNSDVIEEYDAEAEENDRNTENKRNMATQTVRFALRQQAMQPDAEIPWNALNPRPSAPPDDEAVQTSGESRFKRIFRGVIQEVIPTYGMSKKEKEDYYADWAEYLANKKESEEYLEQQIRERNIRDFGSVTSTIDKVASENQENQQRMLSKTSSVRANSPTDIEVDEPSLGSSSSAPARRTVGNVGPDIQARIDTLLDKSYRTTANLIGAGIGW